MKVKLLYGPPCGGKTTHIRENAEKQDAVWDTDLVMLACSNIGLHTTEKLNISQSVYCLRKKFVEDLSKRDCVDTLWFACRYPTDYVMSILDGLNIEKVPIIPDKETCYRHLEGDDMRPDKDEWRAVIDSWYEEFGNSEESENERRPEPMKDRFWKWVQNKDPSNDGGERTLYLDGVIDDESWWGDEVTPAMFRDELKAGSGDIVVWINSPGGSVFAADQIYNMLREYDGKVTIKIDAIAASAASVIAMAGDTVLMSPVATLMIHNPATIAMGDREEMQKAIEMLDSIKESILNAYMLKTGLSHKKLSEMMDAETFMDAKQALSLGFVDALIERDQEKAKALQGAEPDGDPDEEPDSDHDDPRENDGKAMDGMPQRASVLFSGVPYTPAAAAAVTAYCKEHTAKQPTPEPERGGRSADDLLGRLELMKRMF